jgi:sugar-specific transcriptional regulator TrmB
VLNDEEYQLLIDLGLSQLQAKVYLALLESDKRTATDINKKTKIARQEVYRIVEELEPKGIVTKTITSPVQFHPTPLPETLAILIETRINTTSNLLRKIRTLKKTEISKPKINNEYFFKILDIPQSSVYKFPYDLRVLKKFDLLTTYQRWTERYRANRGRVDQLLKSRAIVMRVITEKPSPDQDTSIVDFYRKFSNFQIRFLDAKPKVMMRIYNERHVQVSELDPEIELSFIDSNHPQLFLLGKTVFEEMWQKASLNYR